MWENTAEKCTRKDISLFCTESAEVVPSSDLCLTEIEKDVGGWLYNEVNLYPLKECQFLACHSLKLHEESTFLVTDMISEVQDFNS